MVTETDGGWSKNCPVYYQFIDMKSIHGSVYKEKDVIIKSEEVI